MIPKLVHATWKSKDILTCNSFTAMNGIQQAVNLNPEWKVTVYDDDEIDQYLRSTMDQSDYNLIEHCHIVEKSDIWRLYKLYLEGGVYMDIDRLCNTSFNDFITDEIRWVLPTCRDFDFSHDFMMTAPENPAFLEAINMYLIRRKDGHKNVYFLGPQNYMHSITKTLFGEMIDTNPGLEVFSMIRAEIEKYPFILTYREDPPYDTVVYRSAHRVDDLEKHKRQLYIDFNMNHWTGEW